MKSILLHIQDDPEVEKRVENALAIARATDAHLEALHVVPEEALAVFESFGGIDSDRSNKKEFLAREDALEAKVRAELDGEDVSWEYRRFEGSVADSIIALAALSDLIVVGRKRHEEGGRNPLRLLGDLLYRSDTPLFIRGDEGHCVDINGPMMIAWDGSYEVANAVRQSLGLLSHASEVHVVRVTEHGEEVPPGLYPLTRVMEYLSRYDIHAEYSRIAEVDRSVREALLGFAKSKGAQLMVMGGYSHSRLEERLFGGMTREVLKSFPIAAVISR